MVAMNLKKGTPEAVTMGIYDGLIACCKKFNIGLAGGDFSSSENGISVVVSLVGTCPKNRAWTRKGAKPGNALFVTGSLGGSRAGKHLDFTPRLVEAERIREIIPNGVRACIDITDGLSRDVKHLCTESSCGALVYENSIPISKSLRDLPRSAALTHALNDGEDFELLLAVDYDSGNELLEKWENGRTLTFLGELREQDRGISIRGEDGVERPLLDGGYEHVV